VCDVAGTINSLFEFYSTIKSQKTVMASTSIVLKMSSKQIIPIVMMVVHALIPVHVKMEYVKEKMLIVLVFVVMASKQR
jgi:hypothetical protein